MNIRKYLAVGMIILTNSVIALPQQWIAKVVNVIDGNTVEVLTAENETYKVLLRDVDCPEIGQEYGEEAKKLTEALLLKKKVTVVISGKDRWGNRVADVTLPNGRNVNEELLKKGYAWHNTKWSKSNKLKSLEESAKRQKLGVWKNENPTPPWVYRRYQTMKSAKSR